MSPDIRIYDPVELAVAVADGRNPKPLHELNLPDVSGEFLGDNGSLLKVNMDGINGTREVQHLVLSGDLIGERISIILNNQEGRGSIFLSDSRLVDVYVAKATDQTRRVRPERARGERKSPLRSRMPRPYETDLYVGD